MGGREQRELAGESRAYAVGKPISGDWDPGETIGLQYGDEADSYDPNCGSTCPSEDDGDPQEDEYGWLLV